MPPTPNPNRRLFPAQIHGSPSIEIYREKSLQYFFAVTSLLRDGSLRTFSRMPQMLETNKHLSKNPPFFSVRTLANLCEYGYAKLAGIKAKSGKLEGIF